MKASPALLLAEELQGRAGIIELLRLEKTLNSSHQPIITVPIKALYWQVQTRDSVGIRVLP